MYMILYLHVDNLTLQRAIDFHGRICVDGNNHCILKIDILQGEMLQVLSKQKEMFLFSDF